MEKMEEEKLKARYARPVTGHSAFLQKRLAKGVSKIFFQFPYYVSLQWDVNLNNIETYGRNKIDVQSVF